jgi:ATP/maltotriose-dependent transcriptional regulator MalT/DNA-binding SARP family transcriptional activator
MPRMAPSDPAIRLPREPHAHIRADPYPSRDLGYRPPIAVGPGRPSPFASPAPVADRAHDAVTSFPVQYAKVQPPPLRDETLARDRLLDWLHVKIHSRVVLILADAGYGKTTLLADFARRTRLRTLWYRLDVDDLDWTAILHHLVAAGREHDPSFAPATVSMLAETGINGPSRESVMDVFIRELPTIAPNGAVLIFDDFHLVDEAQDMRYIARELVARAPERLSLVFASRRGPTIPLARLRANGEVAELGTHDLRFDASETARLFSETYGRTLEPDVLDDVTRRTEGWAASLQLVQAALRDRSPAEIRRFVRGLTGADQELYDYLAEEVVGDLASDLQQFLMQTSILQVVTQELAVVVTGMDAEDVVRLTVAAERLTLLGRRAGGPRTQLRYHPLVREFLESRLDRDIGSASVRALHERVGRYAERTDWRTAAHHYSMAGDRTRAYQVIDGAAQDIVAKGEYSLTEAYLPDPDDGVERASFEVLRSRREFKHGDVAGALKRAHRAVELDPTSSIALINLASLAYNVGEFDLSMDLSRRLATTTTDPSIRAIAEAFVALIETSVDGDLNAAIDVLTRLGKAQVQSGESHFAGVTFLNLANLLRAQGDCARSLEAADEAIDLLESSSAGPEVASALLARGWALAQLRGIESATEAVVAAGRWVHPGLRWEITLESAEIETFYGSIERASDHIAELELAREESPWARSQIDATRAQYELRLGNHEVAKDLIDGIPASSPSSSTAHKAHAMALRAHLLVAVRSPASADAIATTIRQARRQGAGFWLTYGEVLQAVAGPSEGVRRLVRASGHSDLAALSAVAELAVPHLEHCTPEEMAVIEAEAAGRPERWRDPLRAAVDSRGSDAIAAARVLEAIGTKDDIPRLRALAKQMRGRPESALGRALARRVAPRVQVEDQGRVAIAIGERVVDGSTVRRKVLGLLCFLVSRPRLSATRDEVLDALWPDFDPADALNSLNQTVYFLRRVFEPAFSDDLSPGYVDHEGDVVWLDSELVSTRSHRCWDLIRGLPPDPSPAAVAELAETYRGPFALDFAYEEWASAFRSNLQSSYLQVVEKSVRSDIESGHFARGITLARRALEACPDADSIELSLLRLYKLSGSHAAASEQYAHYSVWLRDTLGVEPPTLESL